MYKFFNIRPTGRFFTFNLNSTRKQYSDTHDFISEGGQRGVIWMFHSPNRNKWFSIPCEQQGAMKHFIHNSKWYALWQLPFFNFRSLPVCRHRQPPTIAIHLTSQPVLAFFYCRVSNSPLSRQSIFKSCCSEWWKAFSPSPTHKLSFSPRCAWVCVFVLFESQKTTPSKCWKRNLTQHLSIH